MSLHCRKLGPAKDNGVLLEFRVRDTGIGLDDDQKKHLFQAFSQADGSTTRQFGGTGLGLAICRKLLTLMGGEISLESIKGRGTVVTILCPFGVVDPALLQRECTILKPCDPSECLNGRTVLLVEDNPVNRQIAIELLQAAGVDVVPAEDGRQALRRLEETPALFDVVLMDLQMPGMDGYTATAEIRKQPRFDNLPIIAMTAHAMVEERDRCLAAGMVDHISKPIDVALLYATLARVICG